MMSEKAHDSFHNAVTTESSRRSLVDDDPVLDRSVIDDQQEERDGVAIIGIGCRFPGALSPRQFWQVVNQGIDATSRVPADRFPIEEFYDSRPGTPGKVITERGGFI